MADTYDAQVEALLAGDLDGFVDAAVGDDEDERSDLSGKIAAVMEEGWYPDEDEQLDPRDEWAPTTLFYAAWNETAHVPGSLFANLPGMMLCASQAEWSSRPDAARMMRLFREDSDAVLHNPGEGSEPTREVLEEFARRQRAARGAG